MDCKWVLKSIEASKQRITRSSCSPALFSVGVLSVLCSKRPEFFFPAASICDFLDDAIAISGPVCVCVCLHLCLHILHMILYSV